MPKAHPPARRSDTHRQQLAQEAAKLMVEGGLDSARGARRKIAERYSIGDTARLPDDSEIEAALRTYQRLFRAESQPKELARLRQAALEAMEAMSEFRPRLVGSVLDGTADEHSAIHMNLYCDEPEAVLRFLGERSIPTRDGSQRLFVGAARRVEYPTVLFANEDIEYRLTVLPFDMQRQAIALAADEPPINGASVAELRRVLIEDK